MATMQKTNPLLNFRWVLIVLVVAGAAAGTGFLIGFWLGN